MEGYYSASQIARMVGVSSRLIKVWEDDARAIPSSLRVGVQRKRMWSKPKAKLILDYAKSIGYPCHSWGLPFELRESNDTSS